MTTGQSGKSVGLVIDRSADDTTLPGVGQMTLEHACFVFHHFIWEKGSIPWIGFSHRRASYSIPAGTDCISCIEFQRGESRRREGEGEGERTCLQFSRGGGLVLRLKSKEPGRAEMTSTVVVISSAHRVSEEQPHHILSHQKVGHRRQYHSS